MKHSLLPGRHALTCVAAVSSLVLLSACADTFGQFRETFTGRRHGQSVDGPRRMPVLNPSLQATAPEAPSPRVPTAPAPQENAGPQPILLGHYHNSEMPETAPEEAPQTAQPIQQENFFSRLFHRTPQEAPVPAAASPSEMPTPLLGEIRKPIPGNPYYSHETTPTAPVPPGPQPSSTFMSEPAPEPQAVAAITDTTPEPNVNADDNNAQPLPKESWFSRTLHKVTSPFKSKPAEVNDPALSQAGAVVGDQPYPALSSIPDTPEQFTDIKMQKQQQMEDLQTEHMQALTEKQQLDSEPSQLEASQPVEASVIEPAKSVPTVHVQPFVEPVNPKEFEPVIAAQEASKPNENLAPEPALAGRQPYWWEGWNLFGKKHAAEENTQDNNAAVISMPSEKQETSEPLVSLPTATPSNTQPVLTPVAPPVAESTVTAPSEEETLPPPAILQHIKTLPPSRYLGRIQTLQRPLDEQ